MNARDTNVYYDKAKKCYYGRFKRTDGRWATKYLPVTIPDMAEARVFMKDYIEEYERTQVTSIVPDEPPKTLRGLIDWWPLYLEERGVSPEILTAFPRDVKTYVLSQPIADMDLESVEAPQVEDWMKWLRKVPSRKTRKPLAPLSIQRILMAVRTMVDDAIRRRDVTGIAKNMLNPFRRDMVKVMLPKGKRVHGNTNIYLEKEAVSALLQAGETPFFRKVLYVVAIATGARHNEVAGWLWSDLKSKGDISYLNIERQLKEKKFGRSTVEYGPPKKDSFREIPLHPEAVKALHWWFQQGWEIFIGRKPESSDPIFPMPRGYRRRRWTKPLRPAGVPGHWLQLPEKLRKDLKACGQSDLYDSRIPFDFKTLRKTFVTWLEQAKVSDERRGRLMGHAGQSVQDRNYIGRHVEEYYAEVIKLPLPFLTWTNQSVEAEVDSQAAE